MKKPAVLTIVSADAGFGFAALFALHRISKPCQESLQILGVGRLIDKLGWRSLLGLAKVVARRLVSVGASELRFQEIC
jgi:hypothetical protein